MIISMSGDIFSRHNSYLTIENYRRSPDRELSWGDRATAAPRRKMITSAWTWGCGHEGVLLMEPPMLSPVFFPRLFLIALIFAILGRIFFPDSLGSTAGWPSLGVYCSIIALVFHVTESIIAGFHHVICRQATVHLLLGILRQRDIRITRSMPHEGEPASYGIVSRTAYTLAHAGENQFEQGAIAPSGSS
jgi:hypothetical protein